MGGPRTTMDHIGPRTTMDHIGPRTTMDHIGPRTTMDHIGKDRPVLANMTERLERQMEKHNEKI